MTPHKVRYCSLSFLPATFLSVSLEALFELTRRPSTTSVRALLQGIQGHCQVSGKGPSPPGHRQEQLRQTLIVCLSKHTFLHMILDCYLPTEYN